MKRTVLITGATGFLGSHITELLCQGNFQVIAIKRCNSNLKNCKGFQEKVIWINSDERGWQEKAISYQPQIIVHTAWIGVLASERDDWEKQTENITLLNCLLNIAQLSNTKKVIALGSQAEYGNIDSVVLESHPLKPTSAYGAVKIVSSQLLKFFCSTHQIQWYWLRVFSIFGEREGIKWLLPSLIQTIASKKENTMAFTPCKQQFAYLYVRDFAEAVKTIIHHPIDNSGIYNICSDTLQELKAIITSIRDALMPDFHLDFGALPYRENQSMLIAGDTSLYKSVFGDICKTSFQDGIDNIIQFYTKSL